jgi:ApaG protein
MGNRIAARFSVERLMSDAQTRGVRVQVTPEFLPDHSQPKHGLWMFAYHIRISNESQDTVQLLSRHWIITDANGKVEEVKGPGVVGQQPVLKSGEEFEYTSGCPLSTPMGTMHGSYQMVTARGERFDATIAPFTLAEPYSLN